MQLSEYQNMYNHETTHWWYRMLHELTLRYVKEISAGRSLHILDAGCGTGRMLELLSQFGNATGIEYSPEAIAFAMQRGLTNIQLADLNTWQPVKQYNLITSLDVLYHEGIESDAAVLKKFADALEPGGYLILNLPAFEMLRRHHDEVIRTKRRYSKKLLKSKLVETGFVVRRATYRLPHLFCIIVMLKILHPFTSKPAHSDLYALPAWINRLLLFVGRIENWYLTRVSTLPIGSSVFIVAQKTSALDLVS